MNLRLILASILSLTVIACGSAHHDLPPVEITKANIKGTWQVTDVTGADGKTVPFRPSSKAQQNGMNSSYERYELQFMDNRYSLVTSDEVAVTSVTESAFEMSGTHIKPVAADKNPGMGFEVISLTRTSMSIRQIDANGKASDQIWKLTRMNPKDTVTAKPAYDETLNVVVANTQTAIGGVQAKSAYPLTAANDALISCQYQKGASPNFKFSFSVRPKASDTAETTANNPSFAFASDVAFDFTKDATSSDQSTFVVTAAQGTLAGMVQTPDQKKNFSVSLKNQGQCSFRVMRTKRDLKIDGTCTNVSLQPVAGDTTVTALDTASLTFSSACTLGF
jgi:hypothetical protein